MTRNGLDFRKLAVGQTVLIATAECVVELKRIAMAEPDAVGYTIDSGILTQGNHAHQIISLRNIPTEQDWFLRIGRPFLVGFENDNLLTFGTIQSMAVQVNGHTFEI